MIGDKWHAEAAGSRAVRRTGVVGERNRAVKLDWKRTVERD
jgi:hypothetical protein